MLRFLATMHKELLILKRDGVGLLVLFVMPAVLVVVITLVQTNAMKVMGRGTTEILFVNNDHGKISMRMETDLEDFEGIKLIKSIHGQAVDRAALLAAVSRGDFQVGLILPEHMTEDIRSAARRSALEALAMEDQTAAAGRPAVELELQFDPTVPGTFRSAIKSQLQLLVVTTEVEEKMAALAQLLPIKVRTSLEKTLKSMGLDIPIEEIADVNLNWDRPTLLTIHADTAQSNKVAPIPDAVQQNVPAWSLFGIFFIIVPMAGSFIKERLCGVQYRMLSMPVSYLTIATGKVCAYVLVCAVQFSLILCIGRWLLPLLGTAPFQIGAAPLAAAAVALSAILAATGYGILLGTAADSYEQASMFGPISVVIAAAVGGIMVPVFAMPPLMQKLSLVSPLGWAQNAFLDLLVRGAGIGSVQGAILKLLAFALTCIGAACLIFIRKRHQGRL